MNARGAAQLNRITPKLPAAAFKSYSWRQPLATHFRKVTCAEFGCKAYRHGWVTLVDVSTELGQRQYHYITHDRTRRHHEEKTGTGLISFTFPPGQEFFAGSPQHEHRRPIGYDPVTLVHGGDFRGNPRQTPSRVMRPQDWVDDFATHQETLARAQR
jgi:hypothetical protein